MERGSMSCPRSESREPPRRSAWRDRSGETHLLTLAPFRNRRSDHAARLGDAAESTGRRGSSSTPERRRPVLVLNNVTKTFPNGRSALREVDLVVPEGDFVFLVGQSGAGKSTLIKLLIRDELATEGQVVL